MPLVDFLGVEKVSLDFSKAGLGIVWGEKSLDIFIQTGLVLFYGKEIVSLLVQDGLCQVGGIHERSRRSTKI